MIYFHNQSSLSWYIHLITTSEHIFNHVMNSESKIILLLLHMFIIIIYLGELSKTYNNNAIYIINFRLVLYLTICKLHCSAYYYYYLFVYYLDKNYSLRHTECICTCSIYIFMCCVWMYCVWMYVKINYPFFFITLKMTLLLSLSLLLIIIINDHHPTAREKINYQNLIIYILIIIWCKHVCWCLILVYIVYV